MTPTNYPGALDVITNPSNASFLNSPNHADQHINANDAIEAIQAELGINPSGAQPTVVQRLVVIETNSAKNVMIFTGGGTFTVPANVTSILVEVLGGGGGGASSLSDLYASGGGAGGRSFKRIDVTPGTAIAVSIGSGGVGGVSGNQGGNGGTSSFGAHCSATGGIGGRNDGVNGQTPGGLGGNGSGGDLNVNGMPGGPGWRSVYPTIANSWGEGGFGGSSPYGGGGRGTLGANNFGAESATGYGSGGGGAGFTNGAAGGAGSPGLVIVRW